MEEKDKLNSLMRLLDFAYSKLTGQEDKSKADVFWINLFAFIILIIMTLLLNLVVTDIDKTIGNIILFSAAGIMIGIMWQYVFRKPPPWIKKIMPFIGFLLLLISFSIIIIISLYPRIKQFIPDNNENNGPTKPLMKDTVNIVPFTIQTSPIKKEEEAPNIIADKFEFTLNGRLQNSQRKGIANLKVILENKSNNLLFELKTDEKGYYRTSFLFNKSEINFDITVKDQQNKIIFSKSTLFNNKITTTQNILNQ